MVQALGYSNTLFNPFKAGRLCRGRERWIEPWEEDPETELPEIHRLVLSGADFSDISARDAKRGLPHSGVDTASIITSLFPRRPLLAFMEDGHLADIPENAEGVELYDGYRAGGRSDEAMVRWFCPTSGVREIRAILTHEVRGFALPRDLNGAELFEQLFPLIGMSTLDSPPARFQPAALPDLLTKVKALILLHRDKHGHALAIYSLDPIDPTHKLQTLCKKADSLLVPFAIPPMLARWDRALTELRDSWQEEEPFPVPEPDGGYSWQHRRRRRGRSRREDASTDSTPAAAPQVEPESEPFRDDVLVEN